MNFLILDKTSEGDIVLNYKFFIRLAIFGFVGDILFNYISSNSKATEGPIKGLKDFYKSTTWLNAAIWASIIFVVVVFITILPDLLVF